MNSSNIRVMIVEDEGIIALGMKKKLEAWGYEVTAISNSYYDTISKVELNPPDLMLMDINLKGNIDGVETAKYLKEVHKIPSIFISSNSDDDTKKKVSQVSSIGIIPKSLDDSQFHEIMITLKTNKSMLKKI